MTRGFTTIDGTRGGDAPASAYRTARLALAGSCAACYEEARAARYVNGSESRDMLVVILAAGLGTRLGEATPKPLVSIGGNATLLGNQVSILERFIERSHIHLVLGHEAGAFRAAFPDLRWFLNERYRETNTARSLALALDGLSDDDILWMNGDVYFESAAIDLLLSTHAASSRILVNSARTGEEEVKYDLSEDGSVRELSKQVRNPRGESLGVQIVLKRDLPALERALAKTDDHDYFEKAIELAIQNNHMRLMPVPIGDGFCCEVDTPDDLARVRKHVRTRGKG